MIIESTSEHRQARKVNKELEDSRDNAENNQPFLQNMNIPFDLNDIQPRATQVWNCDEIWFYPNGRWNKVICTYKFFQGELMWKVQTGEWAPFWCTLIVFTWAYGKCFMSPIIVHQYKEYSKDLHFNITLDLIVHHTPYGYMDRDGWLKAMIQFSNICGASLVNNQIIFFSGHYSHFDDRALIHIWITKTSNPSSWNQATLSMTTPMILDQMPKWSLSTMRWSQRGC